MGKARSFSPDFEIDELDAGQTSDSLNDNLAIRIKEGWTPYLMTYNSLDHTLVIMYKKGT